MPRGTSARTSNRGLFLRSARTRPGSPSSGYPFDLPAVRNLSAIRFGAVTMLVGDNGTGKSTVAEAIAVNAGFNAEGGSRNLQFDTYATHSPLYQHVELLWNRRPRWGWFMRAETFYGLATHIATDDPVYGVRNMFPAFHDESHGESFMDLALSRFTGQGFYVLDEPESALSLQGQLKLMRVIYDSCAVGSQFLVATHSPILMAYPGADLFELDNDGVHRRNYDDIAAVQLWRRFLLDPPSFLRHLLDD